MEGSSMAVLVDVIFSLNIAYLNSGNIFSTVTTKLYFMNMPIPTDMVGPDPIYACDAAPTNFCSDIYQVPCALDDTSIGQRVYCSCNQLGWEGGAGTIKRLCQKCSSGRWSDQFSVTIDSNCKGCSPGKWSAATGATSACINLCDAGKYSTDVGASS